MVATAQTPTPDALLSAIRFLAGRCDFAARLDGAGFNRFDADFGHRMADQAFLTPKQAAAAWKMVRKYRGQLEAAGIDFDAIPVPPEPAPEKPAERPAVVVRRELSTGRLVVSFDYDAAKVDAIKSLPAGDRKWDRELRSWSIVPTADACRLLLGFGGESIRETLVEAYRVELERKRVAEAAGQDRSPDLPRPVASAAPVADRPAPAVPADWTWLLPFQVAGVGAVVAFERAILADEPGLGKTRQAIAALEIAGAYPAVVVVPATLKENWRREFAALVPHRRVAVLAGRNGNADLAAADVVVANYDIISARLEALVALRPAGVVLDESHMVKNSRAQRTKAATTLMSGARIRLALTGTPLLNRPFELVAQLKAIGRLGEFGGFWKFVNRYCDARHNGYGYDFSGSSNVEELHEQLLGRCMIRRTKTAVLPELPEKRISRVDLEISNRSEYEAAVADVAKWLADRAAGDESFLSEIERLSPAEQEREIRSRRRERTSAVERAEQLVRIETLKSLAAKGKLDAVVAWARDFFDGSDEKLVVFAHHRDVVVELSRRIGEIVQTAAPILGGVDQADRQASVDAFQNDPTVRAIVLSTQAGGVGLTLTAASNVAVVELPWTPALFDQAVDRCHRIGQRDSVTAWTLVASGTIESEIETLLAAKRSVIDAVVDGISGGEDVDVAGEVIASLTARGIAGREEK